MPDRMNDDVRRAGVGLILTVLTLVGVPFLLRLWLLETRGLNPDELEHLHWSWCVGTGLIPYRDYFDHHTPWLHFFLSRFFSFYEVERIGDDAIAFILMARRWMWLFTGAVLTLTFCLAKTWRDRRTGLVATLLLSNTAFFLSKTLEIRPAVPAAGLLVGAILLALVAVRRAIAHTPGAGWRFLASGLSLGAATMFTQKILFVGPGFALVTLWFLLDARLPLSRGERFRLAGLQVFGYVLPVAMTLGYFAWNGAAWHFIDSNLIVNARWSGLGAWGFLVVLVRQDAIFVLLAAVGFLIQAPATFRFESVERGEPVLALSTFSLWATLPLHTGMSYQHFLLILPITSLYAAWALVALVDHGVDRFGKALSRVPSRNAILALLLLSLSIVPLIRFRATFDRGNWATLQAIRYVLRNTAPWETTLDGFTGLGLFRPQAFFHHFQHPHAFLLQTKEEHEKMLEALETGRALPKLIFWSHYLRDAVTPEIKTFLDEHYVPTGLEPIRVRPFDNGVGWWSDVKPRYLGWEAGQDPKSPHVLFEYGWRQPSVEFGASVRRTRTRRSKLIVPIRHPQDFKVVLRARADNDAIPFAVELVVNGHGAGVVEAVPRWQDYEFLIGVHQLRPGFNEFEFRFSAENLSEDRRLELAVNYVQLVPVTLDR